MEKYLNAYNEDYHLIDDSAYSDPAFLKFMLNHSCIGNKDYLHAYNQDYHLIDNFDWDLQKFIIEREPSDILRIPKPQPCIVKLAMSYDLSIWEKLGCPREYISNYIDEFIVTYTGHGSLPIQDLSMNDKRRLALLDAKLLKDITLDTGTQIEIIRKRLLDYEYLHDPSEETQKVFVTLEPLYIYKIDNPSKEVQRKAITANPLAVRDITHIVDPEIALLAVKLNPLCLESFEKDSLSNGLVIQGMKTSIGRMILSDKINN